MKRALIVTASIATMSLSAGCTTQAAYEAVRANERNHCNELPETERQRCLERTQDDFEEYERKKADSGLR